MEAGKKRKEIWLYDSVIETLKQKAESKGWSVKQYIEIICGQRALEIKRDSLKAEAIKESNKKKK